MLIPLGLKIGKDGISTYKCRSCGENFTRSDTGAAFNISLIMNGGPTFQDRIRDIEQYMNCPHNCDDNHIGIADLIGAEYPEEAQE